MKNSLSDLWDQHFMIYSLGKIWDLLETLKNVMPQQKYLD